MCTEFGKVEKIIARIHGEIYRFEGTTVHWALTMSRLVTVKGFFKAVLSHVIYFN